MAKQHERINLCNSLEDILLKMSIGNPGAIRVLSEIFAKEGSLAFLTVLDLDDMGMRGAKIWIGFNDYCKQDLDAFIKAVQSRDKEMLAMVNNRELN